MTDRELLKDYYTHAQLGPFDAGPDEYLRQRHEQIRWARNAEVITRSDDQIARKS